MGLCHSRSSAAPSDAEKAADIEAKSAIKEPKVPKIPPPSLLPGKAGFDEDLAEAVSSSRTAFSFDPEPEYPLPTCFFRLHASSINSNSFEFQFQWEAHDGAELTVIVHDVEKYPTGHSWSVTNNSADTAPGWVTSVLDKQGQWNGLPLRKMLQRMNDGFWGRSSL